MAAWMSENTGRCMMQCLMCSTCSKVPVDCNPEESEQGSLVQCLTDACIIRSKADRLSFSLDY